MLKRHEIHQKVYFSSLILLAVSLPLSVWMTTFAEILLVINWLAEGNMRRKFQLLHSRKSLWLILSLYLLYLVWLINTSDFSYAFHALKIKLPVLILPLVIGTSGTICFRKLSIIMLSFAGATLAASLVSFAVFTGIYPYEYNDIREISVFIWHIRLSLMVVLSVFILLFQIFSDRTGIFFHSWIRIIFGISAIWLVLFLFVLKSLTGLMVFGIVFLYSAWKYSGMIKEIAPLFIVRTLIICIPLIVFSFLSRSAGRFYYREEIDFSRLDQYTFFGNPYTHDTLSAETENGYHVWIYVNEDELREGWNSLSQYKYDGKDKRGQDVRYTLIRYMTSKGLRKDISGLRSLDPADIFAIEKGNTNYLFLNRFSLYPRVYEVLWEIEKYRRGEDPGGHSVAQRLVYLKAAVSIIRENPVFGTGTGDVRKELIRYYENNVPELDSRWWGPAHNQFITFLVVFGITGFVLAMAFFFLPPVLEKRHRSYLFNVFFIIVILSMLTDDTLETQTGVSFVMFFYSLFVFGNGEN